jgi:hypothetical protein
MAVNGVSAYSVNQVQTTTNWQQAKQSIVSLDSALKSGDLQAAKDAFSKLSQVKTIDSNSPLFKIGQSLQKDDIKSAWQVVNPAQTGSSDRTTPLAWQQLTKLASGTDTSTNSTASVNNKLSSLLSYLSAGDTNTTNDSTSYTSGIINQVLSQINNNSASSTVSLGNAASAENVELYTQLAQQVKNNPQLASLLVERLKAQSSNGVFSYL